MTNKQLSDSDIFELIDTYGGDAANYPEQVRSMAQTRITEAPEVFQSALAFARAIDADLGALSVITPSKALIDSIIDAAPISTPAKAQSSWWRRLIDQGKLLPATGAFAALVMGLVLGLSAPTTDTLIENTSDDAVFAATFGGSDYSYLEELHE